MMTPINHDSLFKWLITLFYREFFAHYFPGLRIGKADFIDKEFIDKYDKLAKSMEGDLLVVMELEIEDMLHNVVVYIEHKSWKTDPREQVMEYAVYAWLLKRLPVWSMVVFTDDAQWQDEVPDGYWLGYTHKDGKQFYSYDIIKVNRERSEALIAEQDLFTSLLALKANSSGLQRDTIVRSIFQNAYNMGQRLTKEHQLLIHHYVEAYSKVPEKAVEAIKEEIQMTFVASTISEHFIHIGEERGEERGRIKGEINLLKEFYSNGTIDEAYFKTRLAALERELEEVEQQVKPNNASNPD